MTSAGRCCLIREFRTDHPTALHLHFGIQAMLLAQSDEYGVKLEHPACSWISKNR
jgi:hypothetical protein